jgi:hypothetical protein
MTASGDAARALVTRDLVLRSLEVLQLCAVAREAARQAAHEDAVRPVFKKHSTWRTGQPWPRETTLLCWHCCHNFQTPPIPLPLGYDPHRDTFDVTGTFCSFACVKTFNAERNTYLKDINATTITLFAKRWTGTLAHTRSAPPRLALSAFGGWMSIQEFRDATATAPPLRLLPPKMLPLEYILEQQVAGRLAARSTKTHNLGTSVDFKDTATKNETLKLKRNKPLQKERNTLERTMGINVMMLNAAQAQSV